MSAHDKVESQLVALYGKKLITERNLFLKDSPYFDMWIGASAYVQLDSVKLAHLSRARSLMEVTQPTDILTKAQREACREPKTHRERMSALYWIFQCSLEAGAAMSVDVKGPLDGNIIILLGTLTGQCAVIDMRNAGPDDLFYHTLFEMLRQVCLYGQEIRKDLSNIHLY